MFELPQRATDVAAQVEAFFQQRVLPNNKVWTQQAHAEQATPEIQQTYALKPKGWGFGTWLCLAWVTMSPACD